MRIVFYIIGVVAALAGIGLIVATAFAKIYPLTGYSAGLVVALAGALHLLAAAKNYHGEWAFVTGIALVTLGLASLGTLIDEYSSGRDREEVGFAIFLITVFLLFGGLCLSSGHKLHRLSLQVQRKGTDSGNYPSPAPSPATLPSTSSDSPSGASSPPGVVES